MKYLYVDNFRGFTDTYIPIKDVNFLVGDNSTGKTSILALINLLSKADFWFKQNFNAAEINLGVYYDLVSECAKDKRKFRIGYMDDKFLENKAFAFLLTFCENEGQPYAIRYDNYFNGLEINIDLSEKEPRYKSFLQSRKRSGSYLKQILKSWIDIKKFSKDFKLFKHRIPYGDRRILFFLPSIVLSELKNVRNLEAYDFSMNLPNLFIGCTWIAPIRSKPRRTYDEQTIDYSATGEHIPYLIRKILKNRDTSVKFIKYMSEFGKKSTLFESIDIKEYGEQISAPFELKFWIGKRHLNIKNVGYGVSQSLPVIVELFNQPKGCWFAIQQPEVHLHPKAQAALGDIIFKLSYNENKKFFIETHTDYTIDRFRSNIKKSNGKVDSQVLFFEKTLTGNKLYSIDIMKDGQYSKNQPKNFRSFFIKEQLRLLGI